MKRYCYFFVLCMSLLGCGDFLEEASQDEVRPSTTEDLEQLMLGEAYLRTDNLFPYLDLLTDDVQNAYSSNERDIPLWEKGTPAFMWSRLMLDEMAEKEATGIDTWEMLYAKIKGCNVALDMLERVEGGVEIKQNLKGQALALRSYYYFLLVNTFAQPYNKGGIDLQTAPGVPLILESIVKDDFPPRASLAKVYEQIESDLLLAADLIDKYGQANIRYKVTPLFVHHLLSRLYLYMEQWDKVVEQASIVIAKNPMLRQLDDFYVVGEDEWGFPVEGYDVDAAAVYNYDSPEMIWGYGSKTINEVYYVAPDFVTYPGSLPIFAVSDALLSLYEPGDLRVEFFYMGYIKDWFFTKGILRGRKMSENYSGSSARGMRVAETYLNRAEAKIRLFLENGNDQLRNEALEDLNYLRSFRFKRPYSDVNITDGQELLKFCLEERRRELSFEDHRWFDLRRLGMPELRHTISFSEGQKQEVILEKGSDRYVLLIPTKVLERNPALVQNP